MTDIAPIKGLIELTDNFTSPIGLAEAALSNFSKQNQESLKAVAGAAGLVTAAFGAIAFATIELGKRGSEVNDVNSSLEHFAGGASAAKAAMDALREGTKGTVDNFALAKDAAHLLSVGIKLTTEDFGTLGQAAFVLKTRGFGGTKEQLDLVSEALITGRTRTLARTLGVIDAGDAEENYARKLGVSKDQLSDAGKAEAKRIEVMRILNAAVKDAGDQQRSFGDEFKFVETQVTNFVDELGSAIASSKVFAAGFRAIEAAVSGAFDNDKAKAIDTVIHFIEDGAIKVLDFAQGAISMARVVEGAFELVKTVILGTETVIVGLIDGVVEGITAVAEAGGKLHIVDPETVAGLENTRSVLRGMTADLAAQTVEAGKAVVEHTAFDNTLDSLSNGLSSVRTAMSAAKDATVQQTKASSDSADAAKKNAASQAELNAKMIDQQKIAEAVIKSSKELSDIWTAYYQLVAKNSGTSRTAQIADIEATFQKQVGALEALDPLFDAKYKAYRATADEQLKGIASDWDSVKDSSIEGMQETADKALATWERMQDSGLHFKREVMDAQLQKWRDLQAAANGWGDTAKKAIEDTAATVRLLDHAWVTDADVAAATINKTTVMVKTLSGELISLAEAQQRQRQGGSSEITSANLQEALKGYITNGGLYGVQQYSDPYALARQGYSFAEIIRYAFNAGYQSGALPPPQGPRIPGFEKGGTVMVGESGPEVVRLPLGSTVYPTGTQPGSAGGVTFLNTFNLNGADERSARIVTQQIMKQLKSIRQFGSA